ncbi:amino-acid N-acetyltransferase [Alginatibacterium sediminis]|uniref:Amino-acid acetyltransferase n=1 Tax=Alginatibacterium sediminis TaxID=2164068 RepID=A0A420E841_9ALTE|nr:amino-acid N-acetyltransferase [Alginatibacterium sediminis]RKF15646.1 amino-acid N-acetyltransferase [Alginatibacterium sediminis]
MSVNSLVSSFRQSAPYLHAHRGQTFVISLSGEAIAGPSLRSIINDIALLHSLGLKLVLVLGARPQINQQLSSLNIESHFHKRVRVTSDQALAQIKQVAGALQLDITARLSMSLSNTPMYGSQLSVVSGNFVIAQPLGVDDGVDYCHSGRVRRIDVAAIERQLASHSVVVLGPIAASVTGESFNLMAEDVATQVAIKLGAEKMLGFSSNSGVLDEDQQLLAELLPSAAHSHLERMIAQTDACQASIAFLSGAINAVNAGVGRCHLVSYKHDGALIQELFSRDGSGTQIVMESAERLRSAEIGDIGGILDLIRPLEEQGVLVRRSREQLELEISFFTVIEIDGLVVGCVALYPFAEEQCGEFACLAVHPSYRDAQKGSRLLQAVISQAKARKYTRLFALTTRSIHWFLEQGFEFTSVDQLPAKKKQLYNNQRNSKILSLNPLLI